MKRWAKWLLALLLVLGVLAVLALVFKDSMLRVVAENRIRAQTGMEARIGKFSSGKTDSGSYIAIENLKLFNTPEFGGQLFLDIPELRIELDTRALAQRKLNIKLARLNLAELDIVKNEAGQTNVFSIKSRVEKGGGSTNDFFEALGGFEFEGIEVLNLSLGKAKFIDLKDSKKNREVRVDLQNQIFPNVKAEADIYGILFIIWLRSGGAFSIGAGDAGRTKF